MYFKEDYKDFIHSKNINKYKYMIIDPPWNYDDKPPSLTRNQLTYTLWDNYELKDIFNLTSIDYIFLWCTNSMLPVCFECAKDTEFEYKTLVTWIKSTRNDNLFYGLGNSFRNCTEQMLVFSRKGVSPIRLPLRTAVFAEAGERTGKPKAFEKQLVDYLSNKGMNGVYIFSGGNVDFMDAVDIVDTPSAHKINLF